MNSKKCLTIIHYGLSKNSRIDADFKSVKKRGKKLNEKN
jgi:hypothetical protein